MFDPEVVLGIIDKKIYNNSAFGDLLSADNKESLMKKSVIRTIEAGEVLCRQNQYSNSLFLILKGEMRISSKSSGKETTLGTLNEGELVGEISALFMTPRIATATATQPSIVLEISGEVFSDILSTDPNIEREFFKRCKNMIIETTLRCSPAFNNLDTQSFSELCYISSIETVMENHVICHEGTMEKIMYVIGSGTARAYTTIAGKEINIALLQPGDYFGEYSLFTNNFRCASVSALTDMQLIVFEGEMFQSFIDYNEETEEQINQQALSRKQSLDQMRENLMAPQVIDSQLNQIQSRLIL